MLLQIELQDLRNVIKEKCEELIADKKLAYELYWKICDIEEDPRFKEVVQPDCEHAEHDSRGCLGYSGCSQDDEPIEACKRCGKYTGAEEEGE